MLKILNVLYEWLIVLPIAIVITVLTALFTIVCFPFKNAAFVHEVQFIWSKMMVWLWFTNVQVEGVENIRKGQSYVFVANHSSYFDTWVVYGWLPVVFKWVMKAELRVIPFVGTACKVAGHIFIDRSHPRAAAKSIEEAKSRLHDGVSVVIFPEGTRTPDGEVKEFKRGAFQIAFDLELPVIPLSISGTRDMMPKGDWFIRWGKPLKMKIGQPIDICQYEPADKTDTAALKEARIRAMEDVRQIIIAGKEF